MQIPSGGGELTGLCYVPEGELRDTALLFAHGFTSAKHSMDLLTNYLAGKGYFGLTFDFVGHKLGGSGGALLSARQLVENLQDALHWLRETTSARQIVLVGHSMGAATALQVAALEEQNPPQTNVPLSGVVCLCMGVEPSRGFDGKIGQTMLQQRADYVEGAPALQLLRELDELALSARDIPTLPVLFVAAQQDVLIPVARVEALASLVGPNASVTLIGSSHLEAPDRSRVLLAQWLESRAEGKQGLGNRD